LQSVLLCSWKMFLLISIKGKYKVMVLEAGFRKIYLGLKMPETVIFY
jgi:hypothetical protein